MWKLQSVYKGTKAKSATSCGDAFVTNIDRSARNANMMGVGDVLWLIDHGAAMYFHHGASDWSEAAARPFPAIRQHVLLPLATELPAAQAKLAATFTRALFERVVALVPDAWLGDDPAARRAAYLDYLERRTQALPQLVEEAARVRAELV